MTPVFNLPPGTKWLAALNLAAYALDSGLSALLGVNLKLALAFRPHDFLLYGFVPAEPEGLLTHLSFFAYMFLHADLVHLAMNVFLLLAFGAGVERRLGAWRTVALYLLAGLMAPVGSLLLHALQPGPAAIVGASGAISGLFGALLHFAFRPQGRPGEPRPRTSPAVGAAIAFVLVNLLFGVLGFDTFGEARAVAWEAHLAGALAGWLTFPLLDRRPPPLAPFA